MSKVEIEIEGRQSSFCPPLIIWREVRENVLCKMRHLHPARLGFFTFSVKSNNSRDNCALMHRRVSFRCCQAERGYLRGLGPLTKETLAVQKLSSGLPILQPDRPPVHNDLVLQQPRPLNENRRPASEASPQAEATRKIP